MLIHIPNSQGAGQVPLARIARELDARANAALSILCHVLAPPLDAPRVATVVATCLEEVNCFCESLAKPSNELVAIEQDLLHLNVELTRVLESMLLNRGLDVPLFRRFSRYPAWAMFLILSKREATQQIRQAVGGELALSLQLRKRFPTGLAGAIRRAVASAPAANHASQVLNQDKVQRSTNAALMRARRVFAVVGESAEMESSETEDLLTKYLRRRQLLGTLRHKEGIPTWRQQSERQMLLSAIALRQRAEEGDQIALATILAFLLGVTIELVLTIPFDSQSLKQNTIQIDLETGTVITRLDRIFPEAARPATETSAAYHESGWMAVKPIPEFVHRLLKEMRKERQNARTLGELLFVENASGRQPVYSEVGRHQPSTKRFLDGASSYMLVRGVNRSVAAALSNDFHIVPIAKFYYTTLDRSEIWTASEQLFSWLEWGNPTPLLSGPSVGSQVTPTRAAIKEWYQWMASSLMSLPHGRNMRLKALLEFHNTYARLVGSLLVFDLAARASKELKFQASMFMDGSRYLCLADKQVGMDRGAHPVPISEFCKHQVQLWLHHCEVVKARVEKLGNLQGTQLQEYIEQVLFGQNVPLVFCVAGERAIPVGTADLTRWWPSNLRFTGNFGRHFWQRALKERGVPDSYVDAFVRHQSGGAELFTSTSITAPTDWIDVVAHARDALLDELKITPVCGLSRRPS